MKPCFPRLSFDLSLILGKPFLYLQNLPPLSFALHHARMMSTLPSRRFHEQEMDGGHSKDSKASSDAGSSAEASHNAGGSRRPYYECTFCKRGFSNAQALGGHMNIHRRDRRPPAAPLVQDRAAVIVEETAEGYGYHCGQYANSYGAAAAFYQPPAAYAMYLPASAAAASGYGGRQSARAGEDGGVPAAPYEMSLFGGEELRLGLSAGGERRRQEVEEGELDLELRLGHHP